MGSGSQMLGLTDVQYHLLIRFFFFTWNFWRSFEFYFFRSSGSSSRCSNAVLHSTFCLFALHRWRLSGSWWVFLLVFLTLPSNVWRVRWKWRKMRQLWKWWDKLDHLYLWMCVCVVCVGVYVPALWGRSDRKQHHHSVVLPNIVLRMDLCFSPLFSNLWVVSLQLWIIIIIIVKNFMYDYIVWLYIKKKLCKEMF